MHVRRTIAAGAVAAAGLGVLTAAPSNAVITCSAFDSYDSLVAMGQQSPGWCGGGELADAGMAAQQQNWKDAGSIVNQHDPSHPDN